MPGTHIDELLQGLSEPSAYPGDVSRVSLRETRRSLLFFTEERAYKFSKRVPEGPRDVVREQRRRECEEIVRLSKRVSPAVHRGVVAVVRHEDDRLEVGGTGTVVDWGIELTRLPSEQMLEARLLRGDVGELQMEQIARTLATLHERSRTGPATNLLGVSPVIRKKWLGWTHALEQLSGRFPEGVASHSLGVLRARLRAFVTRERDVLERRLARWRVREGHGDLGVDKIGLADGGVQFLGVHPSRVARAADVARDVASLAVDLDDRGFTPLADHFVDTYVELARDPELRDVLPVYRSARALERADRALQGGLDPIATSAGAPAAIRWFQLALGYQLPGSLVLVQGPEVRDATARYVAGRLRAPAPRGHGNGACDPRAVRSAVNRLKSGRSVVVASAGPGREHRALIDAARRTGAPALLLWLGAGEPGMPAGATSGHPRAVRCHPGIPPFYHCSMLLDELCRQLGEACCPPGGRAASPTRESDLEPEGER